MTNCISNKASPLSKRVHPHVRQTDLLRALALQHRRDKPKCERPWSQINTNEPMLQGYTKRNTEKVSNAQNL